MFFTAKPGKSHCPVDLFLDGRAIDFVETFTYLGIMLDCKMNFQKHFANVINKLIYKIHLFCKIRSLSDTHTAVLLYKCHLLSFLEYGGIFLEGLPIQNVTKLQRLQNRCLRVCYKANRFVSNYNLHVRAKLLPLRLRRNLAVCQTMYKLLKRD